MSKDFNQSIDLSGGTNLELFLKVFGSVGGLFLLCFLIVKRDSIRNMCSELTKAIKPQKAAKVKIAAQGPPQQTPTQPAVPPQGPTPPTLPPAPTQEPVATPAPASEEAAARAAARAAAARAAAEAARAAAARAAAEAATASAPAPPPASPLASEEVKFMKFQ